MMREELQERLKQFALRVFCLVGALPRTAVGRAIAGQLARSAPAAAANYRSTCRARSKAEFSARIGVVLEEIDESAFWLELVVAANLLPAQRVAALLTEATELTAIFSRSFSTARRRSGGQAG